MRQQAAFDIESTLRTALRHAVHNVLAASDEENEQRKRNHTHCRHFQRSERFRAVSGQSVQCARNIAYSIGKSARNPVGDHLPGFAVDEARPNVRVPRTDKLKQCD